MWVVSLSSVVTAAMRIRQLSRCRSVLVSGIASLALANSLLDPTQYHPGDVIQRDVAIVGGGSTGTYTAVHLRDHGLSVAVIEAQDHLGGHAETYTAANVYTIDIGVVVFANISIVKNYFSRFDVPLVKLASGGGSKPNYVDFSTGRTVSDYIPPSQSDVAAAYASYTAQLKKYPELESGFNLSYPVAPDLLLPFGDFVKKYNLSAMMPTVFITNQGYAPILDISTLYMLKYLNLGEVTSLSTGFLTTAHRDIQELYQKAFTSLNSQPHSNVFLKSNVIAMDRSCTPAKIVVQTPQGRKLIMAKRLVNTAPPLPSQLKNFDLSRKEMRLFSQFYANGYYTGIMTNTSLPVNYSAQTLDPAKPYAIPTLPGIYSLRNNRGAPGYVQVYYGSPTVLSSDKVKANIVSDLHRLEEAQGLPKSDPQWAIFSSHAPFNLMVPPNAISNGFYKQLYGLQGERNTFWGGAAWHVQDSSYLWQFCENYLVPAVLSSLVK